MLLSAAQSHVDGKRALFRLLQLTLETQLLDLALDICRNAGIQLETENNPITRPTLW
jgi:hypothetical protein